MVELASVPEPDPSARAAVAARAARVLRPAGALASLDEIAAWLAGWQRSSQPRVERPAAAVFVADHGVVAAGVSAYPSSVTAAMLRALQEGVATAAVLAREAGAALEVVDVGVGRPTGDLSVDDALDPDRFDECWGAGARTVARLAPDLLVVGEMGIGNTTAAAAVAATIYGGPAEQWVGRGTGVDAAGLARKTEAVRSARERVSAVSPLEVLRRCGGAELVAMAGAVYEARLRSIPVLLDGYVVTAAVAPLEAARPGALDHCLAAHLSAEPGHALLLERIGKRPLLELDLRLGEASGALLAVPLIRMAATAVVEVATFEEWGIGE